MSLRKVNDGEFDDFLKGLGDLSGSELYRLWSGYLGGAQKLKEKQNELLSERKTDAAQALSRGILQAERGVAAIAALQKFKDFKRMLEGGK